MTQLFVTLKKLIINDLNFKKIRLVQIAKLDIQTISIKVLRVFFVAFGYTLFLDSNIGESLKSPRLIKYHDSQLFFEFLQQLFYSITRSKKLTKISRSIFGSFYSYCYYNSFIKMDSFQHVKSVRNEVF